MRLNRHEHANTTSLNDSMGSMGLRVEPLRDRAYESRPQTANIKGSYALSPNGKEKLNESDLQYQSDISPSSMLDANRNSRGGGYFDTQSQSERDGWQYRGKAQERPRTRDNGHRGARVDQLKPTSNGHHPEDNWTRPSFPLETRMGVSYERSRTMPTALSEVALESGRASDQSAWQEPGLVAGYHGPVDRGYTLIGPVSGSRKESYPHSRANSDEGRPAQIEAVVHAQSTDSRQPHAQKDSLGDLFDNYYGATQDDHQTYQHNKNRQHRSPVDEDMSKVKGGPTPSNVRRQRMTTDDHLQPQPRNQRFSPSPVPSREDLRRDHTHEPSSDARHPRSRSQPNFRDLRSPRLPLDDGFDFGVPGAPTRPPATAPARNEYGSSAKGSRIYPDTRLDQYQQEHQYQGPVPSSDHRPDGYNRVNLPAPISSISSMVHQGNELPDRYRSPPMQSEHLQQMGPPGGRPFHKKQTMPVTSAASPPNPDALPSHPAPVRPGLMQSSPGKQVSKPIPLRQYKSTPSPMRSPSPGNTSGLSRAVDVKKDSVPVTHQELERLKQASIRNSEDQKLQLLLAKKMVEAASVLVDEQTDPRTRNKSREKYILDAHKIVKKLSNSGYSEATFYLADAYSRGSLGLESDTREAFKLYQSAAKAGHAQAAYRVAVCCEIGHEEGGGTSRDAVKAMQWYKRAATLGDTPAMYKMGIISLKGLLGQPKNPKEAVVWLKQAAEHADVENPHALHELVSLPIRTNIVGSDGG